MGLVRNGGGIFKNRTYTMALQVIEEKLINVNLLAMKIDAICLLNACYDKIVYTYMRR